LSFVDKQTENGDKLQPIETGLGLTGWTTWPVGFFIDDRFRIFGGTSREP